MLPILNSHMINRYNFFQTAFQALDIIKAHHWLKPFAQGRGVILTFHHVRPWISRDFAPNRLLEITPDFLEIVLQTLQPDFDLISLDEISNRLKNNIKRPFAVLTFDDGYRDNRDYALPVLKRYNAPWTLFVTTDFASQKGRFWWLELEYAIAKLDEVTVHKTFATHTPLEKQEAYHEIYWHLRRLSEPELLEITANLCEKAEIDNSLFAGKLCLSWDELRVLKSEPNLTIGAHSLSHPRLAKYDDNFVKYEISKSKALLQQQLGQPVKHFCYPVGDLSSAGQREYDLAKEAGFSTAVTTCPGHIFKNHQHHLHALPRISMNGHFQTCQALNALLSGVPFIAARRPKS